MPTVKKSTKNKFFKKKPKVEKVEVDEPETPSVSQDLHKCLRYSLSSSFKCERNLFLKADASNDCSLLVGNVPAYLDLDVVKGFLSEFVSTPIDEIVPLRSNSPGNKLDKGQLTISIVFSSSSGVKEALEKAENVGPFVAENYGPYDDTDVLKAHRLIYESKIVSPDALMKEVEEFMADHDERTIATLRAARKRKQVADEDGWITVTKGSRKVVPQAKKMRGEAPATGRVEKKKKIESVAFYNFQIKESKMKHLNELREKFEEDKKRVALAKAARKFKPL